MMVQDALTFAAHVGSSDVQTRRVKSRQKVDIDSRAARTMVVGVVIGVVRLNLSGEAVLTLRHTEPSHEAGL